MESRYERYHPDMDALHSVFRTDSCFVCRILAGENERLQHFVYEDDEKVAFLDTYPRAYGYTLVAPKEHLEQVTADFSLDDYLKLQRLVYRVSEAVREEVGTERMYLYTFGSNQGNAHVHWHVVPLPAGTPYDRQQYAALRAEDAGFLDIPQDDMAALADRIGRRLV